jgi:caffeoyl-CoA O-methyltransferase
MIESKELQQYLDGHAHNLDGYLDTVERNTHLKVLQSHMISGKHQAVFLKMMALSINASKVLEIGTFTGYTALAFAEAVGESGEVISLECDAEVADIASQHFAASSYGHRIKLIIGEAKNLLADLLTTHNPDLVFIDADKESNALYYQMCVEKMKAGSIILVDNVLWKGKVLDANANDKKTKAIKEFNDMVHNDDRVEACILPIRDGIYFIRKR